ncbi:MAG: hypothetical protein MI724_12895 [Spirochaetales bacterium]|nr:hypothetical protein [Spirochaetales bacterium]
MNITRLSFVLIVAAGAVLVGCSNDDGGDGRTVNLPSAGDLTDYTGTEPSTAAEAQSTVSEVQGDIENVIEDAQLDVAVSAAISGAVQAAATQTETFSGTYTVPSPSGGTITVTGTESFTLPDDPNATSGTFSFSSNYVAEIDSLLVDADGDNTYGTSMTGSSADNSAVTTTIQSNADGSGSISFSVAGESGWSLSVSSTETNVFAGKHILRTTWSGSGSVTLDSELNPSGDIIDELSINGTLSVYNNADELILQTTLTAADLGIDNSDFLF